jgi:coenzyme F420-reducing hydrogenase alpha subunit
MSNTKTIEVHHITRVEGHGNITARITNGRVEHVRFDIVEAPRFFEAFLRGQRYPEVVHVAPRICGICSVSHKCAALKATETALGVEVSEQTVLLRRLAFHGEVISSHALHVFFLAAPDFLGLDSVFPLAQTDKETVLRAMRLKSLGYDLGAVVAGRHTHPVGMEVGGFSFVHSTEKLMSLRDALVEALDDLKEAVKLFKSIEIPQFDRETQFLALTHPDAYAFYDGYMTTGDGQTIPVDRYHEIIREHVTDNSTAKHASLDDAPYMVGALARVNLNFEQLSESAQETAEALGLRPRCFNPFMNTIAQIVESVHCVEESIEITDELCRRGIRAEDELVPVKPRAGAGKGVVEAPRGILFHEYHYDDAGVCQFANHVIPTAQNLANLEADMRELVPPIADSDPAHIQKQLEMLVRAYDPCISCSTHCVTMEDPSDRNRIQ